MSKKKHIFIILIACIVLGFILSCQFFLNKQVGASTTTNQEEELANEVSLLVKGNAELTLEKNKLQDQYNLIHKDTEDQQATMTSLQSSIEQYKIILGQVPVQGEGVTIQFNEVLDTAQITDLINALRNIGIEAIAINGKRLSPTSGWDMKNFSSPYKIQAIGDSNLLKSSLTRPGGIMENIGAVGTVNEEKKLSLPAVK